MSGGDDRARNRSSFETAYRTQDPLGRSSWSCKGMTSQRCINQVRLARTAVGIDPGAIAGHLLGADAKQGGGNCRRSRGVADTHVTKDQKIWLR